MFGSVGKPSLRIFNNWTLKFRVWFIVLHTLDFHLRGMNKPFNTNKKFEEGCGFVAFRVTRRWKFARLFYLFLLLRDQIQ